MSSKVDICNSALINIGANTITSLDDTGSNARICNHYFDKARKRSLRDYPWNFAQKRKTLALIDVPDYYKEYRFAYVFPNDCRRAHYIKVNGVGPRCKFVRVAMTDGTQIILTNAEYAVLFYTSDISDSNLFDDLFEEALEFRLSSLIALPITKKQSLKQEMLANYRAVLTRARVVNNKEGDPEPEGEDSWLESRGI